jgi:flavin reductase (DIM6/NTAB) family NADH-FMN oxidoreductase RutF
MTFNDLMSTLGYEVFIVTTVAQNERAGCLVGLATPVSIDPPRFLACLSVKNRTYRVAAGATGLAVHFVPEDAMDLARLFGSETGDEIDKFSVCDWTTGPMGCPILDRCPSWFVGNISAQIDLGDHQGFLLDPVATHCGPQQKWLAFPEARSIQSGHAP